ncbi:MAG: hypothetical protein J7501_13850 [Bdellovibrio sp.]|nr:hypothetical protein [Bdellovibrio sp.]
MKKTDLFIFLDLVFAMFSIVTLGTLPLVGSSVVLGQFLEVALTTLFFGQQLSVSFLTPQPILDIFFRPPRDRKTIIQFLDPLLI